MEIVLYRWFKKNAVRWLESKKMDSFFNKEMGSSRNGSRISTRSTTRTRRNHV
jgi:hypothetical protein